MVCEETSWKRKVACTFYTCICCVDSLVVGWVKVMNTCICFVTILLNFLLEKWTNNSLENIPLGLGNSYYHIVTLERIEGFVKIYQQHAPTN